ncbi:MAG: hypothetical protein HC888_02450 [Candidatus Competibacteraceae bacterium]|nr:hypothetical protein [Candidatus Competibacteraceae bacterium]
MELPERRQGSVIRRARVEGQTNFEVGGSTSFLNAAQETDLKAWVSATLPNSTREVGAFNAQAFDIVHESRSGLIVLAKGRLTHL